MPSPPAVISPRPAAGYHYFTTAERDTTMATFSDTIEKLFIAHNKTVDRIESLQDSLTKAEEKEKEAHDRLVDAIENEAEEARAFIVRPDSCIK